MSAADLSARISDRIPALKRYARFLTRNAADADDLVQDCIERAIKCQHQFKPGTNLDAWLNTIMRSIFINGKRHEKLVRDYKQRQSQANVNTARPAQVDHIELKQVINACGRLSDDHQKAIELLCIRQMSCKEAARIMRVPEATVKTRLFRARERLRMQFAA